MVVPVGVRSHTVSMLKAAVLFTTHHGRENELK
jgi:hypothetical protein